MTAEDVLANVAESVRLGDCRLVSVIVPNTMDDYQAEVECEKLGWIMFKSRPLPGTHKHTLND